MSKGEILTIEQPSVFMKSFANLSISIEDRNLNIQKSYSKVLVSNDYISQHINED